MVAISLLSSFSSRHNCLRSMAGLMGVTAFLSMWINNSAASSIMLPVSLAITAELESHSRSYQQKKKCDKEVTAAINGRLIERWKGG